MYKLSRQGFRDVPTLIGPNGEVTLNLAKFGIENIDTVPVNVNVLILDHNYIRRLENLSTLCDLQQLSVANNKLLQMHGVAGLINLTILNLPNNGIATIDGLKRLTCLRWLNLSGNKLKVIEQLETNVNLKHLDLSDNYIYELRDISHLVKLKTLLLHCNHISSVQNASKKLPNSLEILSLASNMVSDILEVQELSCLPMLLQFSLGNNPCTKSFTNHYKLFVLSWLPNLRILDGASITKEDIENASSFVSGLRSSPSIQLSSQVESAEFNQNASDSISNRSSIHPIDTKLSTNESADHYLIHLHHHNRPVSPWIKLAPESNQNFASEEVLLHCVGSTSSRSSNGELAPSFNNSCVSSSTEDSNHRFQSTSPSVSSNATILSKHLSNNNSVSSPATINDKMHLHLAKYNNKTMCSEGVNMSSCTHASNCVYPKFNNNNKGLNISKTSSFMTNRRQYLKMSNPSSSQIVLPETEERLFYTVTRKTVKLSGMNSCCDDQFTSSSFDNLLSSDSVYLPLNLSNSTKESASKTKTHSDSVCIVNDDDKLSSLLKLSPSDTLLSSGNFIPLHRSVHLQLARSSNSSTSSLDSIKSKEIMSETTTNFINSVHLIHDGEDDVDNNDNEEEEEDVTTETTVQSSRFTGPLEESNNNKQVNEVNNITHDQNGNCIMVQELSGVIDSSCLISLKNKINTQHAGVANYQDSVTDYQQKDFHDDATSRQSVQSTEVKDYPKLSVTDMNDKNPVESNSVATNHNVTTPMLSDAIAPIISNIDTSNNNNTCNPVTLLSSTSSVSSSCCCPTCGNQTKLLQDHVVFLQKQLQTQYKSNEAELKLNQLHSNSIQFLLREVEELKAWKEAVSLTLTNSDNKSVCLSNNFTQTDIEDTSCVDPASLFPENTLNNVNLLSNDNRDGINEDVKPNHLCVNITERTSLEDKKCKNRLFSSIVQSNAIEQQQGKDCELYKSIGLNGYHDNDDEKTSSAFAKMSIISGELSELSELQHTLRYDDHFTKLDGGPTSSSHNLDNVLHMSSSAANTSNILGSQPDIEFNTVTDSYDLEDFSDLELVRQAVQQAMNLDSASIDASFHSNNSSVSIVTSSIS
ncbi:Centrosomal protein of 97 kDa [Schistosoma japonicum]|uniref:Centrosomal protein of 97 kDa n=2 Tax=Schistosoma japonicum TaxID=6182 RepID=A0A4Z2DEW5_SCHJA|nr:Centrosomal protein of 97 kDa [Schistosoma japonicum]